MDNSIYTVTRIDGEYAYIASEEGGEELFIAMALLPLGTDVGSRLEYRFPEFILID